MKKFNLTGVCVPDKHYMVDLTEKVNIIVRDYIEQGGVLYNQQGAAVWKDNDAFGAGTQA